MTKPIKKEQRLSKKWRDSMGFYTDMEDYGYVRLLKQCDITDN